jgi:predicted ATPase/class 3 adenylate cyclase
MPAESPPEEDVEIRRLQAAIDALQAQSGLIPAAVLQTALAPLRSRLAELQGAAAPAAGNPAAATTATTATTATQALRLVSILFLDVVGSTALAQRLDPEEVHAVMDGALQRCTAVVQAHHGKVLQYAGDNLLAVFGADSSHERDAEDAVLCGLALLDEGRALAARVQADHGHAGFGVRVGIHTGGVLLGGGVDAEGTIRGNAVNVAARMEQTAPAGGLRISGDTWAQVRGMFEVEPQPALAVKGIEQPVASVLVRRAKPRALRIATRGIEGVATRMVGREAELQQLQGAFETLLRERRLATLTVVADAGVGKSRLLDEFRLWSDARPEPFLLWRGRAHPHSQRQPYALLRELLAWRLQLADDEPPAAARDKLLALMRPLFSADDGAATPDPGDAQLLAHLLGFGDLSHPQVAAIAADPRLLRDRGFHAFAQLLRRLSAREGLPVVMQLEDLHWADDASLDLLERLAEVNADMPLLLVALARPTLYERRGDWPRQRAPQQRMALAPLDAVQSDALVQELLQRLPQVPPALRELLVRGAEGNPFYMEELVRMLVDQGAIVTGGEPWQVVPERLQAARVPTTLTGVLQARLDGLPEGERRALQQASVVGAVFWEQALQALDAAAHSALPPLVRRELVLPRPGGALEGLREYGFRHHLLHQVTYDSVLRRDKRELHARLAHWLSALADARGGEWLALTAEHYDKAGERAPAVEFHARAAAHARDRFAPAAALEHVQRALQLLKDAPQAAPAHTHWRLHEVAELAWGTLGRRAEQRESLQALHALAESLDDDARRIVVAQRLSFLGMRVADYGLQEREARRGMALAERVGDARQHARALRMLAAALDSQGRTAQAKALALEGLAAARAGGWRFIEAQYYNTLYSIAMAEHDLVEALRMNEADLAICRELGDRLAEAVVVCNIGESYLGLGDLEQATRWAEDSLQRLRAVGERTIESSALSDLSRLALWRGDADQALEQARAALEIAESVQAPDYIAKALLCSAEAELARGRWPEADAACRRVLALQAGAGGQAWDAQAGCVLASLAAGDAGQARQQAEPLLTQWHAHGHFDAAHRPRLPVLACWRALDAAGEHDEARALLRQAHEDLQRSASTVADASLRRSYLERVPEHRALCEAWARVDAASPSSAPAGDAAPDGREAGSGPGRPGP